jgi:uncharacterized protein
MKFLELAQAILKEAKTPLSPTEIWQSVVDKGYDKQLGSEGKTPWATLYAQIYVSVRDNPKSPFQVTDSRPKKFFLKSQASQLDLTAEAVDKEPVIKKKRYDYLEKDLHPYLTYYSNYHLNCFTKTINHSQSTKKEFGEWVHPDMVGCHFTLDEWKPEVYELSSAIGNISVKLLSFELKREISFGNLRESFFQTVSNSSWANESYLVAAEISDEQDFIDELRRLSTSFGIGIIKLNLQNPHSSELKLPAKYRETLDWETMNKLATMNSDFKEFLTRMNDPAAELRGINTNTPY